MQDNGRLDHTIVSCASTAWFSLQAGRGNGAGAEARRQGEAKTGTVRRRGACAAPAAGIVAGAVTFSSLASSPPEVGLRQTPSAQWPLVHCTSNLHGAPRAAALAGPHAPSSPETLSSARQRSLAVHVRSQQSCPRSGRSRTRPRGCTSPAGFPRSIGPPSCASTRRLDGARVAVLDAERVDLGRAAKLIRVAGPDQGRSPASATRPAEQVHRRHAARDEPSSPGSRSCRLARRRSRAADARTAPIRARSAASETAPPNRSPPAPSLATSFCSSVQRVPARRRRTKTYAAPRRSSFQCAPDERAVAGERDGGAEVVERGPVTRDQLLLLGPEPPPLRRKTWAAPR